MTLVFSSPDRSPTPPVKDSSVPTAAPLNNLNTPSASQDDNQTWALYPKQLVLSAPSKGGCGILFTIKFYSLNLFKIIDNEGC